MESKNATQVATDLEYNDGLGDLLREKEKLEFSWIKTSTILIFVLALIVATTSFLFKSGKDFIQKQSSIAVPYNANQETDKITTAETTTQPIEINSKDVKTSKSAEAPVKKVISTPVSVPTNKIVSKTNSASLYTYKVIAGTFKNRKNANTHIQKLKSNGFDSFLKVSKNTSGTSIYKVQTGAFKTRESAMKQQSRLTNKGIDSYLSTN